MNVDCFSYNKNAVAYCDFLIVRLSGLYLAFAL